VNAKKLELHPEDIEVLSYGRSAGFPLGNHTYAHLSLNASTADEFEPERRCGRTRVEITDGLAELALGFRYPYLWEGDTLEKRHAVRQYLKEHKYHVAQVTLDFEDYLWNGPYARCAEKNDAAAIEWLKSSYMATAAEYMLSTTDGKLVYGRDIRHVLLLHLGAFETVMLPRLLDFMKNLVLSL